jgi:hypothetical protein
MRVLCVVVPLETSPIIAESLTVAGAKLATGSNTEAFAY